MDIKNESETDQAVAQLTHQDRIAYKGEMEPFLKTLLSRYGMGEYISHDVKQSGYDDFNLTVSTSSGVNFVKCFAERKSDEDKARFLQVNQDVQSAGVHTPRVIENSDGEALTSIDIDGVNIDACVMQYLDGRNLLESGKPPDTEEQREIVRQAALLSKVPHREEYIRNPLAVEKIRKSYDKNKERIDPEDREIIERVLNDADGIDLDSLPHALVHGDISSANVMRSSDGHTYITDFSAAKWDPRVVEIAVLCSDILFDPNDPSKFDEKYRMVIEEYQNAGTLLTAEELRVLPVFIKLMQSLLVIGANSPDFIKYSKKDELKRWLTLGKKGLHYSSKEWRT